MTLEARVNYLSDYEPCGFEVLSVSLIFELAVNSTLVTNRMRIKRRFSGADGANKSTKMRLNGEDLILKSVRLDGMVLPEASYQLTHEYLILTPELDEFDLEVVTQINPQANTALEGLYLSSGNFCTQCEAEGFRRITYFFDRPDVLTVFQTKIIADKQAYPVLLSNGNLIESGVQEDGRHFAVWHDPFKKPCYLFALVAGNLVSLEDQFFTADNRTIKLCIYTDPHHLPYCRHAMNSLIHAMRWDEARFGLIYDLDIYMIVAVDDFNMGAMENKGLNIFNSKYVLADPETATDADYEGVEAVIAHEYFHNWTGNRVTCRDWFQLTLKEGLTVFRDQEFTAERLSPAVKRIEDVRRLRSHQFAEDAGPMSHPIQPQSYIEMNNFYTMTVYEKGAEVVRLYQTLLGREGFRKGMDLYFARHDGQAVTVEDFRHAMADANQVNLDQMQAWYIQAGTPHLKVKTEYNAQDTSIKIELKQYLKGKASFSPFLIPFRVGFLNELGEACCPEVAPENCLAVKREGVEYVLYLSQESQSFEFKGFEKAPYLSLLRGFSAPVVLEYDYPLSDLVFLASHDTDSFNRWESAQRLALIDLMDNVVRLKKQESYHLGDSYSRVFETLLDEALYCEEADLALLAYSLSLPDLSYLVEQYEEVDIDLLVLAHKQMKKSLASRFEVNLMKLYHQASSDQIYQYDKEQIAKRLIKNTTLVYLSSVSSDHLIKLVERQYDQQANMTDVQVALQCLTNLSTSHSERALAHFYTKFHDEPLVLDKWFSIQAAAEGEDVFECVKNLINHTKFSYNNPNRVRSLIGVFCRQNLLGFHRQDGSAYAWLANQVLILDGINPQVASRMVVPLLQWRRFDSARQVLMRAELIGLKAKVKSKDVYELLEKAL